jgi:DNA-binding MarR family transcriptional regulator
MTPFKELDPMLHSQLRLAIMSIMVSVDQADFSYLREKTGATAGNISTQITKLKEGGYIEVKKSFRENYPQTMCRITPLGRKKFTEYVAALNDYLNPDKEVL